MEERSVERTHAVHGFPFSSLWNARMGYTPRTASEGLILRFRQLRPDGERYPVHFVDGHPFGLGASEEVEYIRPPFVIGEARHARHHGDAHVREFLGLGDLH